MVLKEAKIKLTPPIFEKVDKEIRIPKAVKMIKIGSKG